jgi:hypothetical protein
VASREQRTVGGALVGLARQRRDALLAALADHADVRTAAQVGVGAREREHLRDAEPGLDGREQQRVVAASGPGAAVGRVKQRVDLRRVLGVELGGLEPPTSWVRSSSSASKELHVFAGPFATNGSRCSVADRRRYLRTRIVSGTPGDECLNALGVALWLWARSAGAEVDRRVEAAPAALYSAPAGPLTAGRGLSGASVAHRDRRARERRRSRPAHRNHPHPIAEGIVLAELQVRRPDLESHTWRASKEPIHDPCVPRRARQAPAPPRAVGDRDRHRGVLGRWRHHRRGQRRARTFRGPRRQGLDDR